jgi:hypothetical protein
MSTAYRIPDNDCACVPPGTKPAQTVPINRLNVRSFITNLADGAQVLAGQRLSMRGIAFDGGAGIQEIVVSSDGGVTWQPVELGRDLGKYAFREWTASLPAPKRGSLVLQARATSKGGEIQPLEARWNPAGYMRNVVETVKLTAI